ncbi:hypothetical protein NSS94_02690 [Paenibacillus sp. FSL L8-0644]|uniref:hypothetical protein n=1 Tax=Paenibacillus sp. FSL L8-0644 TaxID=2954523 RepID=UPI0030F5C8BB
MLNIYSFLWNLLFWGKTYIFRPLALFFIFFHDSVNWVIKKVFSIPTLAIFLLPIIYILLLGFAQGMHLNGILDIFHSFYTVLNFSPGLSTDIAVIKTLTSVVAFAIPLSLTFFYFSYKEQKALAISNASFSYASALAFVFTCIMAVAFGTHLSVALKTKASMPIEKLDAYFSGTIGVWLIFCFMAFRQGIIVVKLHISNLHVKSQTDYSIKQIKENLHCLKYSFAKFQKKMYFNRLYDNVETLYQLMFLSIDKSTSTYYDYCVKNWNRILSDIHEKPENQKYISGPSLTKGDDLYLNLYKCILNNQINLLIKLIKSHRFEDANIAFEMLEKLESKKSAYYTALHEIAILSFKLDILDTILIRLNNIMETYRHKNDSVNDVNIIFKQLLIIAIENNDVKSLSRIVYSMLKNFKTEDMRLKNGRIPIPFMATPEQNIQQNECIIYMLFQALVKTIELSHYSCTGFLIKFMVTNFKGDIIKRVYSIVIDNLITNKKQESPYLKNNVISNVAVSFNFNSTTIRYCFEKMSLLLYCQQKFVLRKGILINFNNTVEPVIKISGIKFEVDYLVEKIKKAGDKYGLLFFSSKFVDEAGIEKDFLEIISDDLKKEKERYKEFKPNSKERKRVRKAR